MAGSDFFDEGADHIARHRWANGIAKHVHGRSVLLWQLVISRKPHGSAVFLCGQHSHVVTVNDDPAIAGSDGSDGAMYAAPAFCVAVVRSQEAAAVGVPSIFDALQCCGGASGAVDLAPFACIEIHERSGWHMFAALKIELKGGFAAGAHEEHAYPVLRDAMVSSINDVRRQRVAQRIHSS